MIDNRSVIIRDNINRVLEQIRQAAFRSGRKPEDVQLVVVSKGQPVELIRSAILAGATQFGENYAEQAVPKIVEIGDKPHIVWHMIGHIQSRKSELVGSYFSMVQSLDSVKLANRLNEVCLAKKKILPVLLEMNVSGEESKFGWSAWEEHNWEQLLPDIQQVANKSNLEICGLMTMPPLMVDPDQGRLYFRKLRKLQSYLYQRMPGIRWSELSMGTSGDFPVAVEEGATIVRVGQAILGPRAS